MCSKQLCFGKYLSQSFGIILGFSHCHLIRISELELPAVAGPRYELLARLVGQQLQQELPQLDRARALETVTTLVFIGCVLLIVIGWL